MTMASDYIIDVTDADFEFEVLQYSENTPVMVEFWAPWNQPSKNLEPMLERLTIEARGSIRLAKVNVDQSPNLALRYGVRSIPAVKIFSQGQVVAEFNGVPNEFKLREMISRIAPPSQFDLALEKGLNLLTLHQWKESENIFREILQEEPDHPAALLGLAKTLLWQGKTEEANGILDSFPESRQFPQAELLLPYSQALLDMETRNLPEDNEKDAAFENCIRLAKRGNLPAALDGLLDIMRQDRHFRNDRVRLVILSLLELLGDEDPQTRLYRAELAAILF